MAVVTEGKLDENVDILVKSDPKDFVTNVVAKLYVSDENQENNDYNNTKVEAILVPVLKINNRVIQATNIISIKIEYTQFTPSISCTVIDEESLIKLTDSPGMNNEITFVMTSPVNGNYKKIKLNFYITNSSFTGNRFSCLGVLKHLPLDQVKFEALPKSNTYTFLETIAKNTGLGFATTKNCDNIEDTHYRVIQQKKYREAIEQQIQFSGVDKNSMLDCWIDIFGYLNLVNVSHLMTANINPDLFKIKVISGMDLTGPSAKEKQVEEVDRILSNYNQLGSSNLAIKEFNIKSDNSVVAYDGAEKNIQYFCVDGSAPENINNIVSTTIDISEKSVDGDNSKDYQFVGYKFLGSEMDEIPILYQKELRTRYFENLRSKMLVVTLENPNIGLIRGMLVTVLITDDSPISKSTMYANDPDNQKINNVDENTGEVEVDDSNSTQIKQVIMQNDAMVLNKGLSGVYYIDGQKLEYISANGKIIQKLFLIRRGDSTNYLSKYTKKLTD